MVIEALVHKGNRQTGWPLLLTLTARTGLPLVETFFSISVSTRHGDLLFARQYGWYSRGLLLWLLSRKESGKRWKPIKYSLLASDVRALRLTRGTQIVGKEAQGKGHNPHCLKKRRISLVLSSRMLNLFSSQVEDGELRLRVQLHHGYGQLLEQHDFHLRLWKSVWRHLRPGHLQHSLWTGVHFLLRG